MSGSLSPDSSPLSSLGTPCVFEMPFYTGLNVNTQQLIHEGYGPFTVEMSRQLAQIHPDWAISGREHDPHSGLVFDASNREGDPVIPRWLIELTCPTFNDAVRDIDFGGGSPLSIEPVDSKVILFDFGVGIVVLTCSISVDPSVSIAKAVRLVEAASNRIADGCVGPITEVVRCLAKGVRDSDWAADYVLRGLAAGETDDSRALRISETEVSALWVHRVVTAPQGLDQIDELRAIGSLACDLQVLLRDDSGGTTVVPGTGTTVAVGGAHDAELPTTLINTLVLLNAYWAASAKYDEAVFSGISALHVFGRGGAAKGLIRGKAEEVLQLQERVLMFRAVVDHQGHHLSPDGQNLWTAIATAWNLQPLFEGIQTNVSTLDSLFRHVAETVRSDQADRLNRVVTALTVASITTVGVDLFALVSDSPSDATVALRLAFALGPVLVLVALWYVVAHNQ